MRRRALTSLLAALPCALALLACPTWSTASADSASFATCASDPSFSCAAVPVPLDRAGAVHGTIGLSVERRLSPGGRSRTAVVPLAGGPGQPVLALGRDLAEAIAPALGTRDLLLFDQRGTGASGQLSCAALSSSELAVARSFSEVIERCAAELGPARADYTTAESVEDLEAIRRAAGYEKLVLYGTSYGTKVALEYAQRYPQNVEALVLDSVEGPEGPDPFHVDTFKAIRPMLAQLCSARACRHITRNPLGDLARLVGRTNARTLQGEAFDGRGRPSREPISTSGVLSLLLAGDLNPALRAEVPAAVHAALGEDLAPLARLFALSNVHPAREEPGAAIDLTLFIDTSCEEFPFPWRRSAPEATRAVEAETALNALPSSTFYPFDPETALLYPPIPVCVGWPDASPPPPAPGALPNVPTLLLSGEQDLRTPTADARRLAARIPDAQLVTVPYTGHSVIGSDLSGCARGALAAFFSGSPVVPCTDVRNRFPPVPLPPRRLSAVPAFHGVGGRRGETLQAAIESVLDLRRSIIELALDFGELPLGARFGGLRGGWVTLTASGARLHDYSYVPGVRLSGRIPNGILLRDRGGAGLVQVSGSAAAAGSLRFAGAGHITGTLEGRHVSVDAGTRGRLARGAPRAPAIEPLSLPLPPLARLP